MKKSLIGLALAGVVVLAQGCGPKVVEPDAIVRGDAPSYREAAEAYNERADRLGTLWASVVVRIAYVDEDGEMRREQGDGVLQIVQPDRMALSINKVGQRLMWLGCDARQFWWFELFDEPKLTFGNHDTADMRATGLRVQPRDLVQLLGITRCAPDDRAGATQWSSNGRLLGIVSSARRGGLVRVWVDPESYEPRKVELFDASKRLEAVSDLYGMLTLSVTGDGSVGPSVAKAVLVSHVESGTEMRLDLEEVRDDRIAKGVFDLATLKQTLAPKIVIDLDARGGQKR